jgi:hypothetical protein
MNTASNQPLFPVAAPSTRSLDENVKALESVCHVVEVKKSPSTGSTFALCHVSPYGLAKVTELGLASYASQRGPEYVAVLVSKASTGSSNQAGTTSNRATSAPARARTARPATQRAQGTLRLEIKGTDYNVTETPVKRHNIDVRRWEVRKLDGDLSKPYVVTFQDVSGNACQCGCPDWIYRRRQCKHITAIKAAFQSKQLDLSAVG